MFDEPDVPKLTKLFSSLMGVRYSHSMPILAGGLHAYKDALGNEVNFEEKPSGCYFLNLVPDSKNISKKHKKWRFDYIIGDSDAETDFKERLSDKTMIYWSSTFNRAALAVNDAIIVPIAKVDSYGGDNVNESWHCLRRIGNGKGEIYKKKNEIIYVKSTEPDGTVVVSTINCKDISGKVFGSYQIKKTSGIKVTHSLPFMK